VVGVECFAAFHFNPVDNPFHSSYLVAAEGRAVLLSFNFCAACADFFAQKIEVESPLAKNRQSLKAIITYGLSCAEISALADS
jgi:hypothetical protein